MAAVSVCSGSAMPLAKRLRFSVKVSPAYASLLEALGRENPDTKLHVYLITISRVFADTTTSIAYRDLETVTKAELVDMIRDSFDNPVPTGAAGGRPRARAESDVDAVVAVKEKHADGSAHFHLVVKLFEQRRFKIVKRTLRERHFLPSHWSCTHTQLWSAIRYVHVATPKKPIIDAAPAVWTSDSRGLDLVELSRVPFRADAWRKRREKAEGDAAVLEKKAPSFDKLDFYALVLSKHLHTKASLLAYVQDYAPPAAQRFVGKQQRRLLELIEDAQEWADAKDAAVLEKLSDWDILLRAAEGPCPHAPGCCAYAAAAAEIFRQNAATLSKHKLAALLKAGLQHGPSKTCRVPMLIGPSNTGKSTLLYPFDDLFGPKQVFHKPALGSTFALRNIAKGKRFIFWDDYRPVEFAHKDTVPVATFLSLFIGKHTEVQVSQSFSDGNFDVNWQRGVVFTAKEEGLWEPSARVSAEDVRHLRNRVEEFRFTEVITGLKDVDSCAPCMARWIVEGSSALPSAALPGTAVLPSAPPSPRPSPWPAKVDAHASVAGFAGVMSKAELPVHAVRELFADVSAAGAVHVKELTVADWQSFPSWSKLRPLEARRLLRAAAD